MGTDITGTDVTGADVTGADMTGAAAREAAGGEVAGEPGLARFNALPAQAAHRELLACCASAAWAQRLTAGRPYACADAAERQSDAAVTALTAADLAAALDSHPRIGERIAAHRAAGDRAAGDGAAGAPGDGGHDARAAAWARQEQSGMRGADRRVSRSLAELSAAYEERFGHIYLVCATGRSAAELLALLRDRLGNDTETEWLVVRSELQKINKLRLRKLLADSP